MTLGFLLHARVVLFFAHGGYVFSGTAADGGCSGPAAQSCLPYQISLYGPVEYAGISRKPCRA